MTTKTEVILIEMNLNVRWRKMMISTRPRSIFLRLSLLPLFVLMFAFVSYAQKPSKPAPAPAKPAAPAAKPAAPAGKPAGGATTPHPTTAGGAARPATAGGAAGTRGGTTAGGAAKPGATTAGGVKTGATGTAGGAKGGTTAAGGAKGGTTAAGGAAKGGTTAAGGAKAGGATTAGGAAKGGAAGGAAGGGAKGATTAKAPGTVNHPNGGKSVTNAAGNTKEFNKSGKMTSVSTKSGHEAHFDSHGRVTSVHTAHGAVISHGPHGERRVVGERVNARGEHYHVVNYGGHRGYVEHGYMRGGHPYYRRTYMYGGRRYAYAYRGYYYHGVAYYHWAPPYYYPPAYYGWAVAPWPAPVPYAWGWGAAPWYGYYGVYYAPAPVYPYAALWLADFVIAENLRLAYEAAQASPDPNAMNSPDYAPYMVPALGGGMEFNADAAAAAMPADVKQLVSDDIKAQIEEEKAAAGATAPDSATDQVPSALDPKHSVFVVSATIDVPADGDTCSLTAGDIVQRQENEPGDDKAVKVKVLSAKSQDCTVGSMPRVQVTDLQDMHNDFREKISTGMDTLAKGGNGLPKAPDATHKVNPDGQAQPDLNADDDLKAQQADADAADKEVQAAAQPDKP